MPPVLPPVPSAADQWFWDGISNGQLLIQRCASCGTLRHPPAPMCGECHSLEWTAEPMSGRGTVYTWIVSHHPTEPDDSPRVVVLVDLEEGVRFVSNLQGVDPDRVQNDMPVELCFERFESGGEEFTLPQFRLVSATTPAES
jgi:uncharacterized OB-fold protein